MCRIEEIEDYLLDIIDININEADAVEVKIYKKKELDILLFPIIQKPHYKTVVYFEPISPMTFSEMSSGEIPNRYIKTKTVKVEPPILPRINLELISYTVIIKCSSGYYKEIGKQLNLTKRVIRKLNTFLNRIGYEFIKFDENIVTTNKFFMKNSLNFSIKLINTNDYNNIITHLEDDRYNSTIVGDISYRSYLDPFLYSFLFKYKDKFVDIYRVNKNPICNHCGNITVDLGIHNRCLNCNTYFQRGQPSLPPFRTL